LGKKMLDEKKRILWEQGLRGGDRRVSSGGRGAFLKAKT